MTSAQMSSGFIVTAFFKSSAAMLRVAVHVICVAGLIDVFHYEPVFLMFHESVKIKSMNYSVGIPSGSSGTSFLLPSRLLCRSRSQHILLRRPSPLERDRSPRDTQHTQA